MPKIEYVSKKFRKDSLALIDKINTVINDYKAQGYSLTLRQVYYQLVARDIIPNTERSYKNLGNLISDARLAGLIDWLSIEDRTRNIRRNSHWSSPAQIIDSAAWSYHRNHWEGQENYVEVWVEKDALIGIVGQICHHLDVSHFSCRGYVSQSEMWSAAERLRNHVVLGQHIVLLHLGDHDPSGKDMSRDIVERLSLFGVPSVEFNRIALNMSQIEEYAPPPNPTKLSDSRAGGYIEEFGYECWELDALEPQIISDLIQAHVEKYRDARLYDQSLQLEMKEKQILNELSEYWPSVSDNWNEIIEEFC